MGDDAMNKVGGDNDSLASGIDPGGVAPGGVVHSGAKPNPQADEGRSFVADQAGETGGEDERVDTDGDGRKRDPNDTRPSDNGGRGAPVQR